MNKRYSFNTPKMFEGHYNSAVGKYVSSKQDMKEELKRLSDEQSARTGYPSNYVMVEAGDREAFGATDEGMDDFYRTRHDTHVSDPYLDAVNNS